MPTSTLFRADVGIRPYNPYTTMSLRTSDRRHWCGNLLLMMGIPTPVCALARNDIFIVICI